MPYDRDINNRDWLLIEISQNLTVPIVKYSHFKLVYLSNNKTVKYIEILTAET